MKRGGLLVLVVEATCRLARALQPTQVLFQAARDGRALLTGATGFTTSAHNGCRSANSDDSEY